MRKSAACAAISRHFGISLARVIGIAQRASDAGVLPKAEGRAFPDLSADELARLVIAVLADNGLGSVRESVDAFSKLHSDELCMSLAETITAAIDGGRTIPHAPKVRSIVLRSDLKNPGCTILVQSPVGGIHAVFGEPATTGAVKQALVGGAAFEAVAAEWRSADD